jgi:hypothetical protein
MILLFPHSDYYSFFRTAGEVVKRWVNEVQESIREGEKNTKFFTVFEREIRCL